MSSVSQIVQTVAQISLNVDNPDLALQNRIVNYVNIAYLDVYTRVANYMQNKIQTTQTVAITSGSGTLSPEPLNIVNVVDTNDERILLARDIREIEEECPALDDTGSPWWYYIEADTTIKTYPTNNTSLRVRYNTKPSVLTIDSLETDIKIPVEWHHVITEGTLHFIHLDERDKTLGFELNVANIRYEAKLTELIQHLSTNAVSRIRPKYRDF
jgi:hypothetical protein